MNPQLLEEAIRLPVGERVDLVQAIWDSIAVEAGLLTLSDEQFAELDRRLVEHRQNPASGEAWEVVKANLKARGQ
jgi:putative addiction module component (TIGR02574 family)